MGQAHRYSVQVLSKAVGQKVLYKFSVVGFRNVVTFKKPNRVFLS